MSQIHKKFNTDMVVGMLKKYLNKEIDREYIQELLGIKKSRFFTVLKRYKENPEIFSIEYKRNQSNGHPILRKNGILLLLSMILADLFCLVNLSKKRQHLNILRLWNQLF